MLSIVAKLLERDFDAWRILASVEHGLFDRSAGSDIERKVAGARLAGRDVCEPVAA